MITANSLLNEKYISSILKKSKKHKDYPMVTFVQSFAECLALQRKSIEHFSDNKNFRTIVTQNYIINIVTDLEVFFKRTIIEYAGKWTSHGVSKLLNEKITLGEAFQYIKTSKLNPEHLIAHSKSFQSIETINSIYSTLIDQDFFKTIELVDYSTFPPTIKEKNQTSGLKTLPFDWRKKLAELYQLRNEIVHEGKTRRITQVNIIQLSKLSLTLVTTTYAYLTGIYILTAK